MKDKTSDEYRKDRIPKWFKKELDELHSKYLETISNNDERDFDELDRDYVKFLEENGSDKFLKYHHELYDEINEARKKGIVRKYVW